MMLDVLAPTVHSHGRSGWEVQLPVPYFDLPFRSIQLQKRTSERSTAPASDYEAERNRALSRHPVQAFAAFPVPRTSALIDQIFGFPICLAACCVRVTFIR